MKPAAVRRLLGLAAGVALIGVGALEIWIEHAGYESPAVKVFCNAGFCADQFSVGRVFQISQKATLGDPRGELEDFKRGVRLSPASAYRWSDLAQAEFNVGDYTRAEYAISQALKAGPRSGVILMRAANLYFEIGDAAQVVRNLAKVLSDPELSEYNDSVFLTYSRLGIPIEQILSEGIPQRIGVLSNLLNFWTRMHKADEAVATWKWADERKLADNQSTGNFFAFLMNAGRQELAQQLWQDYVDQREPGYRKANWIYNAGFESAPLLSPFDWHTDERNDVEAGRAQDFAYSGKWAFRITFNSTGNTDYHQTYQEMVLTPGQYHFSVMIKTERVTTDEGVRLHIFDEADPSKLNIWTDTLLGTNEWAKLEKTFPVPDGVKAVRVEIARRSSMMFDNKIGGTTWVDELRLSRQ